jgi:hypothetical protein
MIKQAAHGASRVSDTPLPAALEQTIKQTEYVIGRFKDDFSRLIEGVDRDLEKLRASASARPVPPPWAEPAGTPASPWADPASEGSPSWAPADLNGPIADLVRAEIDRVIPKLVKEQVDEQFRNFTAKLQARLKETTNPAQKLRVGTSRKRS